MKDQMALQATMQIFEAEDKDGEREICVSWAELEGKVISRTVVEQGSVLLITNESEHFRIRGFEMLDYSIENNLYFVKNFGE